MSSKMTSILKSEKNICGIRISAVKTGSALVSNDPISNHIVANDFARSFMILDDGREHFYVAFLSVRNIPIGFCEVSVGTVNSTLVHSREVFRPAILINSTKIMLFHNHPSGNPDPSYDDDEMTRILATSGAQIGIHVLDHIIIAEDKFYSYVHEGMMPFCVAFSKEIYNCNS